MIDTNLKGLIAMTRAVVPHMVERGTGHVINISSIAAHEVYPGGGVYCATKSATDAFTAALRHDLVATQVRAPPAYLGDEIQLCQCMRRQST